MGHFLQITITRKTLPFLKKNYTISRDCELQKWATFYKSRSQEKLYNFSRKTIQFLVIANCRKGPLSANYDLKKINTISRDRELQKRATFCKSRSQEILYNFSKTVQFRDRELQKRATFCKLRSQENYTISRDRELQKRTTFCKSGSQEILYNFSKTVQFLVIANCRKGPLSANHNRKKYSSNFSRKTTISRDREM